MSAPEQFDPYREWLGIESQEQPADHYRLLGLARFEADMGRIATAADERMALVRKFQVGPRGRFTQALLNELSAAKVCLLSPADKSAYDAELAKVISAAIGPRVAPSIPPPLPPSLQQPTVAVSGNIGVAPQTAGAMPWYGIVLAITAVTLLVLVGALLWRVEQQQRRRTAAAAHAAQSPAEPAAIEPELEPTVEPVLQVQEGSGEVFLAAATAVAEGGVELRSAGTEQVLANWTTAEAAARWQFRLIVPGRFEVELEYATASDSVGTEIEVVVDDAAEDQELRGMGGLARSRTHKFPLEIVAPGQHTLVVRPRQPLEPDWLELHSVRIIPVSRPEPPPLLSE